MSLHPPSFSLLKHLWSLHDESFHSPQQGTHVPITSTCGHTTGQQPSRALAPVQLWLSTPGQPCPRKLRAGQARTRSGHGPATAPMPAASPECTPCTRQRPEGRQKASRLNPEPPLQGPLMRQRTPEASPQHCSLTTCLHPRPRLSLPIHTPNRLSFKEKYAESKTQKHRTELDCLLGEMREI